MSGPWLLPETHRALRWSIDRLSPYRNTMRGLQPHLEPAYLRGGQTQYSLEKAERVAIAFLSGSPTICLPLSPSSPLQRSCNVKSPSHLSFVTPCVERQPLRNRAEATVFPSKPSYARSSSDISMSACSSEKNGEGDTGPRRQQEPLQARPGLVGAVPLWIFLSLASRIQSAIGSPQKSANVLSPSRKANHTLTDVPADTSHSVESQTMEFTEQPTSEAGLGKTASYGLIPNLESDETAHSEPSDAANEREDITSDTTSDDEAVIAEQNGAYLKQLEEEYRLAMDALSGRIRVLEDALETTEEQVSEWRAAADRATEEAQATVSQLEIDARRSAEASAVCARALYSALTKAQTQHAAAVKALDKATTVDLDSDTEENASGLSPVDVKSATSRAMFDSMMSAQTRATAARVHATKAREEQLRLRRATLDGYKVALVVTAFAFAVMGLIISSPSVLDPLIPAMFPGIAYQR